MTSESNPRLRSLQSANAAIANELAARLDMVNLRLRNLSKD